MIRKSRHGQAMAPESLDMKEKAFEKQDHTSIYWLGNAGIYLNARGTSIMIDPLLEGFDMPLLMEKMPIEPDRIPHLDGVLITHIDNDHFSRDTCKEILPVTDTFVAPGYVADVMNEEGYPAQKKTIDESFEIGNVEIKMTRAWHNWQNESSKWKYRDWQKEDYCGYWMQTPDGTIWLPGDSRLLPEHLEMPDPDVILFDFADNAWHITLEGAVRLANQYPEAKLICIHWGCVDAPEMTPFNGNPEVLYSRIDHPERICVLAPGEEFVLHPDDRSRCKKILRV